MQQVSQAEYDRRKKAFDRDQPAAPAWVLALKGTPEYRSVTRKFRKVRRRKHGLFHVRVV